MMRVRMLKSSLITHRTWNESGARAQHVTRAGSLLAIATLLMALSVACGGSSDPSALNDVTDGDTVPDTGDAAPSDDADAGDPPETDVPDTDVDDPARCGDGVLTEGEACDDGAANSDTVPDACRTDCTAPRCGDGVADSDEACDGDDLRELRCDDPSIEGGFVSGVLRCDASCQLDTSACSTEEGPTCGDDVAEGAEACDGTDLRGQNCTLLGYDNGELRCNADCTLDDSDCRVCGNEIAEEDEACDGADLAGATCASLGFARGTLRCTDSCTLDLSDCTNCGNGIVDDGEVCDDGVENGEYGRCAMDCSGPGPRCGDDVRSGPEDCDGDDLGDATCGTLGFDGGDLACDATCGFDTSACTSCGDNVLNGEEACDGDDHGDATCESLGFDGGDLACTATCTFDTSDCASCGDGVASGDEACDGTDFGASTCITLGFDGGPLICTATCSIETSACTTCGDGVTEGDEVCDDGEDNGTYGACASDCSGPGLRCGDGVRQESFESCDGNDFGGLTCADLGGSPLGRLRCEDDCVVDTSACDFCEHMFDATGAVVIDCSHPVCVGFELCNDGPNFDFENWISTNPPPSFIKVPGTQWTVEQSSDPVFRGTYAARLTADVGISGSTNRDLRPTTFAATDEGVEYTAHVWMLDNANELRTRISFRHAPDSSPISDFPPGTTGYSEDSPDWQELTHRFVATTSNLGTQPQVRVYGNVPGVERTEPQSVYIDDMALTRRVPLDVAHADEFAALRGVVVAQDAGATRFLQASINNQGVLGVVAPPRESGPNNVTLVYVGPPHGTNTIEPPVGMGFVPAPGDGGALYGLVRTGDPEQCVWQSADVPGNWTSLHTSVAECASLPDGRWIGTLDVATLLAVPSQDVPATFAFASVEYSADAESLIEPTMVPRALSDDGSVDTSETASRRRSAFLIGRVY